MMKRIFLICLFVLGIKQTIGQIGVGTITPDASSILDVTSTDKGMLAPRLTTTQRDGITDPPEGLIIYNITDNCLQVNIGAPSSPNWECIGGTLAVVSVNCDMNGFEGTYTNGGTLDASHKFSVTITNNTFGSVDITFATGDLVLSGVGGVSVNTVNPASATIVSGGTQVVEYTLTGTPSTVGTLNGTWTKGGLSCTKGVEVSTP